MIVLAMMSKTALAGLVPNHGTATSMGPCFISTEDQPAAQVLSLRMVGEAFARGRDKPDLVIGISGEYSS